jgi:hypothetical protein
MWFSVNLLFVARHSAKDSADLWEERILLIEGDTESEVERKAKALAVQDQPSFQVAGGDSVQWSFEQVERIFPIEASTLESGTVLFCRFLRNEEVMSILRPFGDK